EMLPGLEFRRVLFRSYEAWRPHVWHVSVTRSATATSGVSFPAPRRRGTRTIERVAQEGQTRGTCWRSAAINASASGARYSFTPRSEERRVGQGGRHRG